MSYSKSTKSAFKRHVLIALVTLIIAAVLIFIVINKIAVAESEEVFFTEEVQFTELEFEVIDIQEPEVELLGNYTITAYCPCEKCCGIWAENRPNGIVYGAAGIELQAGVSVAAPGFEFGTLITIEDLGEYVVQDRTANWIVERYEGKIIDIYFNTHEEALEFGKQYKNVYRSERDD